MPTGDGEGSCAAAPDLASGRHLRRRGPSCAAARGRSRPADASCRPAPRGRHPSTLRPLHGDRVLRWPTSSDCRPRTTPGPCDRLAGHVDDAGVRRSLRISARPQRSGVHRPRCGLRPGSSCREARIAAGSVRTPDFWIFSVLMRTWLGDAGAGAAARSAFVDRDVVHPHRSFFASPVSPAPSGCGSRAACAAQAPQRRGRGAGGDHQADAAASGRPASNTRTRPRAGRQRTDGGGLHRSSPQDAFGLKRAHLRFDLRQDFLPGLADLPLQASSNIENSALPFRRPPARTAAQLDCGRSWVLPVSVRHSRPQASQVHAARSAAVTATGSRCGSARQPPWPPTSRSSLRWRESCCSGMFISPRPRAMRGAHARRHRMGQVRSGLRWVRSRFFCAAATRTSSAWISGLRGTGAFKPVTQRPPS